MIRMIRTITLLTAAFGLITSAIAARAADTNFQIASPSQKSVHIPLLTPAALIPDLVKGPQVV